MIRSNSQLFIPTAKTENGGKPQIRYLDNGQFANLALDEKTGASIDLSIDTSTYVMTVALKNADGTIISSGNIDFPLESVVVNATYESGILTLVLQNGNSVNVDISDIISGLVAEDGDGSNLTASFTESATRTNITTGEKLSVLFGKIKKWFTDLKSLAFKSKTEAGDYTAGSITATDTDSTIAKTSDLSVLVSDVQANGVSVVSNRVANITKSSLGLQNVNNTADVNKVVHGATVLTNQDLNNYKTTALVGWYYAAGGNSVTNKPSGVGEFGLEVVRAANGVFVQRLTYGNKLYQRTYGGSSWSSWIEFANTTGTYSGMTVGNATNATNATNDSNGQKIVDTYAKLTQVSNPNLLINPDFTCGVPSTIPTSANTNICSGWLKYTGWTTETISNNQLTITIKNTVTSTFQLAVGQYQTKIPSIANLIGQNLTLSVNVNASNLNSAFVVNISYRASASEQLSFVNHWVTQNGKQTITAVVPTGAKEIRFGIGYNKSAAVGDYITISKPKLEVGSVATDYTPTIYEGEIWKCKFLNAGIYNPNLLQNPDFSINQRGQESYSGAKGYTVDRWAHYANSTVTVVENGIEFSTTSETYTQIYQLIEVPVSKLTGKTLTLSCSVNGVIYTATGTLSTDMGTKFSVTIPECGNATVRYSSTGGGRYYFAVFDVYVTNPTHKVNTINWAKLEFGSVATEFMSPSITEELPKCQRYGFLLASGPVRYPNTQIDASIIDFTIPTPVSLRTPPTLSDTANIVVYNPDSGMAVQTGFTFEVVHTTSNAICIRATKSAHGLSRAVLGFSANIFLDAEI